MRPTKRTGRPVLFAVARKNVRLRGIIKIIKIIKIAIRT
jgi:hypothetical protein